VPMLPTVPTVVIADLLIEARRTFPWESFGAGARPDARSEQFLGNGIATGPAGFIEYPGQCRLCGFYHPHHIVYRTVNSRSILVVLV